MLFTISVRGKLASTPILDFLGTNFPDFPLAKIDSVFGFLERSTLYGGRIYEGPQLTDEDVQALYGAGIGVRIPLTNHYVEPEEYEENRPFLEKYHRKGNAVIVTNDNLARWIRRDFPRYHIEASVIKNIDTHRQIYQAFDLYDTVVLPMWLNNETEFLKKIKHKKRIRLFANAGCALTCPSKICYPSISKINKYKGGEFRCSQTIKWRQKYGMVDFDLRKLVALGFSRFKVLRARPGGGTGY